MPFGNRENILEYLFNSVLSSLKEYHLSENLKFSNLGILQSLKLRIMPHISFFEINYVVQSLVTRCRHMLPIYLKLNFTPNTLRCLWVKLEKMDFSHFELRPRKSSKFWREQIFLGNSRIPLRGNIFLTRFLFLFISECDECWKVAQGWSLPPNVRHVRSGKDYPNVTHCSTRGEWERVFEVGIMINIKLSVMCRRTAI